MNGLTMMIRKEYGVPISGAFVAYYRDKQGKPIGCVAGVYGEGKVGVGYSMYHRGVEEKPLDKKLGRRIAIGRAVKEWVKEDLLYIPPETLYGLYQLVQAKCLIKSEMETKALPKNGNVIMLGVSHGNNA